MYSGYFARSSKCLGKSGYNAAELIDKLGIKVCPYCNRNFINNATYGEQGVRRTSQVDHFFSKDKYPYLAMSFYNLVPSCPSCNHLKGNQSIDYSPYDKRFKTNELLHFDYQFLSIDGFDDERQLKVTLKSINEHMDRNICVLRLESQYKMHNDIVFEMIKKKQIYTDSRLTEIEKHFGHLFLNKEEMRRVLYGNYLQEEAFHKRPLSKLTSDIYRKVDRNSK